MQNRRRFIRNTLLTAAGTGLASRYNIGYGATYNSSEDKFMYRTLGKTGIRIPVVSMGTGNTENSALVRAALDKGLKLIGTSESYQNGNNEKMVGQAIKGVPRDSFMIMTSSGDMAWVDHPTGLLKNGFTYDRYVERIKGSLSRLGVDHVDILIQAFAAKRESVFFEPVMKAMQYAKKEGLTRFTGIATHREEPEAIRAAADVGIHDVIMTNYNFLASNRNEQEDALKYATGKGMGIIAMKTMAGAYWDKARTKPINTRAALKWVLRNENIHTTVPDCSNFEQLNQDIEVMSSLSISKEELQDLTPVSGGSTSVLFCQQCGECIPQCPHKVDIPTIMRSYMYAYGHHNLPHASVTFKSSGSSRDLCSGCTECKIRCSMGFDIRKKIYDISRIADISEEFLFV